MTITMTKGGGIALLAFVCGAGLHVAATGGAAGEKPYQSRCVDLLAYGADRTGREDGSAAWRAALAAADPRAPCIHISVGTYRFASSPTLSAGSDPDAAIAIIGDGAGLTRLMFDAGISGLAIRLTGPRQSVSIRDVSILASGAEEDTIGLSVIQSGASVSNPAQSEIRGVIVRGRDGFGGDDSFAQGIHLDRVSNVTLANVTIAGSPQGKPYASRGDCLAMKGAAAAISIQIDIVASQFNYCGRGIVYGPYLQGVQIVASNFTGNGSAIHQPAGNVGNDQLAITASQFNSSLHDILLEAPIDGVTIGSNHFYLAEGGAAAIAMRGVQFAVQGNSFHQFGRPSAIAISIGPFLLDAGVITGNTFNNFATAIMLQPGSSRVNVQSNAYSDISVDKVMDRGTGNIIGSR